jgi:hypothetical protein
VRGSELPAEEKQKGEVRRIEGGERERNRERDINDHPKSDVVTSGSPVANPASGPECSLFITK